MPPQTSSRFPLVPLTLILIVFMFLFTVAKNPPNQFDTSIFNTVHNLNLPWLHQVMSGVSFLGETWPSVTLAALATAWLWAKGLKREAVYFVISLIAVSSTTSLIKNIADRTRPNGDDFSFISGHTSYFTVFGGYLLLHLRKLIDRGGLVLAWRSGIIVLVTLIAVSRIYLGAHWPTDVLGGFTWALIILMPIQWRVENPAHVGT